ncbi:hypothetical protein [Corynebacterium antarcticum]|uniref:hypothetical protein n=1 Tax=Corynebacterium antarcticum TaxID=2800405 RepID=UPI002002B13F|nr:hypothetical protein [Corynebacterium antarcticum]MCK7661989.1 hypothetical protein [Corynebacterium antarcticum]
MNLLSRPTHVYVSRESVYPAVRLLAKHCPEWTPEDPLAAEVQIVVDEITEEMDLADIGSTVIDERDIVRMLENCREARHQIEKDSHHD